MITLKLANWNADNIKILRNTFQKAHQEMCGKCDGVCEKCKQKHACDDIARTIIYCNHTIDEVKRNEKAD